MLVDAREDAVVARFEPFISWEDKGQHEQQGTPLVHLQSEIAFECNAPRTKLVNDTVLYNGQKIFADSFRVPYLARVIT
jgi:hypothetical protein